MKILVKLVILVAFAILAYGAEFNNPGDLYNRRLYQRLYFNNRKAYDLLRYYDKFYKAYNANVEPREARITKHSVEPIQEDGSYDFLYETENGIHNEAHAESSFLANGEKAQKVEGEFSFLTPEKIRVSVRYKADENGYRPLLTYDGVNSDQFTNAQAPANVEITRYK